MFWTVSCYEVVHAASQVDRINSTFMASRPVLTRDVGITQPAGLLPQEAKEEQNRTALGPVVLGFTTVATLICVAAYFGFSYLLP